jgi:GDPmannose 4,6-dehydratase
MQWLMLQQEAPEDFVIASGEQHSVKEFIEVAAEEMRLPIEWRGGGVDLQGFDDEGRCIVQVDPRYFRPTEVDSLLGEAAKAREKLGWVPRTSFRELVAEMVSADLRAAERERLVRDSGFKVCECQEWS